MFSLGFQRCSVMRLVTRVPLLGGAAVVRLSVPKTKRFGFEMHQEGLFGMCTEIQEWDGNKYIFCRLIICYKKICVAGGRWWL